jgi:glycosyltransferase involved in cell wall biosynthesis
MKMILFASSKKTVSQPILNLFSGLLESGYKICVAGVHKAGIAGLEKCEIKKFFLGPKVGGFFNNVISLFVYLPILIYIFVKIIFFHKKNSINAVVLSEINEKLIITPIAIILKIKIIWLEEPEFSIGRQASAVIWYYRFLSKHSKIISFSDTTTLALKKISISEEDIFQLVPAARLDQYSHQSTIFSSLAKAERETIIRKYFTIGTVSDYKTPNQLENLFHAIKISLNVAPNIQLVIIGDGADRKKYLWIARKLEIGNLTWFVGEQKHLRKWLENMDLFIPTFESAGLNNIEVLIKAMASCLPICGFRNLGFENILPDEFFVETNNSEILAREIIKYFKDKKLRKKIGAENGARAQNIYDLKAVLPQFEKILEL